MTTTSLLYTVGVSRTGAVLLLLLLSAEVALLLLGVT